MTTINAVDVGLSGSTGTGSFVGSTSPTLVTPILGAATATSLAFNPSTGGIIGTILVNNANAGDVGELISSVIAQASAISLSNNTAADITSISLTAGDWDVSGFVGIGTTGSFTNLSGWTSLTSATEPDASVRWFYIPGVSSSAGQVGNTTPFLRVSISSTTTVYLSALAAFSSGAATAFGGIYARRRR